MNIWRIIVFSSVLFCSCSQVGLHENTVTRLKEQRGHEDNNVDESCAYFYFLWGKSAESMGPDHYEEALEAYDKATVCDETSSYIRRKLALLLARMGKINHAIDKLEQALEVMPEDLKIRTMLANLYTSSGDLDAAIDTYSEILSVDTDNEDVMLILGSLYARQKKYEEAHQILEKFVAMDRESFVGYRYLAGLYRELGFPDKAVDAYQRALDLRWSVMFAFEVAEFYDALKRYEDAIRLYRMILEDDPQNERARLSIARNYLHLNELEHVLEELRELRAYASDSGQVNMSIGQLLLSSGKYNEAIAQFKSMHDDDPENSMVTYLLALSYHKGGSDYSAKELILSLDPAAEEYEKGILLLVRIYKSHGKVFEAEVLLQSIIKNNETEHLSFYLSLAALYRDQGKMDMTEELFDKILVNYPDNPQVLFEYGMYLDQAKAYDDALNIMQQILEMEPENPFALNYIGYTWAEKEVNLEEAKKYVEKAVAIRPDDGFIRDSLGWVFFKMNNVAEAIVELEKAAELEPQDPTIKEHLGDAYARQDRIQEAMEEYEQAIKLYVDKEKRTAVRKKLKAIRP